MQSGRCGQSVYVSTGLCGCGLERCHLHFWPGTRDGGARLWKSYLGCSTRTLIGRKVRPLSCSSDSKLELSHPTFDLALASAVLSANGKKAWERLEKTVLLGELALDGRVRPVKGVLPAVLAAKREGWPAVVVPVDNLAEASLVEGVEVWGVRTLGQLHKWLTGAAQLDDRIDTPSSAPEPAVDLADVVGQSHARFAVEIADRRNRAQRIVGRPAVSGNAYADMIGEDQQ